MTMNTYVHAPAVVLLEKKVEVRRCFLCFCACYSGGCQLVVSVKL